MLTFGTSTAAVLKTVVLPAPVAPPPALPPAKVEAKPKADTKTATSPAKAVDTSALTYEQALAQLHSPEEAAEPVFQELLRFAFEGWAHKKERELHLVHKQLGAHHQVLSYDATTKTVTLLGGLVHKFRSTTKLTLREVVLYSPFWR